MTTPTTPSRPSLGEERSQERIRRDRDYEEQARKYFMLCPFCGMLPNVFRVPDDRYVAGEMNWVVECAFMGCIFKRSSPNRSLENLKNDWNLRLGL